MQGDILAMHELGCMYWYQKGRFMNTPEAIKWFKTAARSGYAESQYFLGQMHQYGTVGHARHLEKAAKYFGMAAQQVPALDSVPAFLYHCYHPNCRVCRQRNVSRLSTHPMGAIIDQ